jgi:ATP-binding cassette subfamily B multidrug efflux pump
VLSLGWVMSILQQGISAMERISLVMEEPDRQPLSGQWQPLVASKPSEVESSEQSPAPAMSTQLSVKIECRNLSYTYPGQERPSLSGVNLSLAEGEVIGITGPVGCGKSTFLHLLTGVLHPEPGQLFINGIDVRDLEPEDHHRIMSFVPQDSFLFSRSMEENIGISGLLSSGEKPEGFRDRVQEAAREAALLSDIKDFPKGLEEWVGEKGVTLSGGQRQRTALARALFKSSPLLLLDDALSAIDADTETKILENIRSRGAEQGMVIVSHRISAIRHASRILVLSEGKVLDEGRHEDLMSRDGLYQHLAELQQMEKELEVVS